MERGAGLRRRQMRMFIGEVVLGCPSFVPFVRGTEHVKAEHVKTDHLTGKSTFVGALVGPLVGQLFLSPALHVAQPCHFLCP